MTDYNSSRQSDARRAFGDPEESVKAHGRMMESFNLDIRKNGALRNRALVLSGAAGLCSSASTLAVLHAAPQLLGSFLRTDHSCKLILWTLTSGLGLGYLIVVALGFERKIYDLELRRELWEIDNHLTGELQEMIAIYKGQGLSEEDALVVTRIFSKQKRLFANLMMVEELGYSRLEPPTWQEATTSAALPTVVGYTLGLLIPLLPVLLAIRARQQHQPQDAAVAPCLPTVTRWISGAVLAVSTALVSTLQTEVFFGAYAQLSSTCLTATLNVAGVGGVYALTYFSAAYM